MDTISHTHTWRIAGVSNEWHAGQRFISPYPIVLACGCGTIAVVANATESDWNAACDSAAYWNPAWQIVVDPWPGE